MARHGPMCWRAQKGRFDRRADSQFRSGELRLVGREANSPNDFSPDLAAPSRSLFFTAHDRVVAAARGSSPFVSVRGAGRP